MKEQTCGCFRPAALDFFGEVWYNNVIKFKLQFIGMKPLSLTLPKGEGLGTLAETHRQTQICKNLPFERNQHNGLRRRYARLHDT